MKKLLIILTFALLTTQANSQWWYIGPEIGAGKVYPDGGAVSVSLITGFEIPIPSGIGEFNIYPEVFGSVQSTNRLEYGARIGMGIPIWKGSLIPNIGVMSIEDTVMGRYQMEMKRSVCETFGVRIEYIPVTWGTVFIGYQKFYQSNIFNIGMRCRVNLNKFDRQNDCWKH